MTTSRAEATAQRLMAIDWSDEKRALDSAPSRAALLREYLRRSALWVERYGPSESWPFFDLAALVDPKSEIPEGLRAAFEEYLYNNVGMPNASEMSLAAVRWAALIDAGDVEVPDLDDLYEPLILLFERGGVFGTAGRAADFWLTMVPYGKPQAHLKAEAMVDMDPASLDALDAKGI